MSHTETLEHAHTLLKYMDPKKLPEAIAALESMLDPVSRALANAPWDDEPETEHERLGVAAARIQHQQHPELTITQEEFMKELGFPPLDPSDPR